VKKWGKVYIDASQIVDLKQFNKGFDFFKSAFNGGIDRTMQPEDAYNSSRVKDNAFLKAVAVIRGDMSALRDNATGSLGYWRGLSYNTYSGDWITIDEFTETNMKVGFLHWEYSFHYFLDQWQTIDNPKRMQIIMLCNGVTVANITPLTSQIGTMRLFADFPSIGGTLTFTIKARTVAYGGTEGNEMQWHITSQNHFLKGLWR